jgi:DNA-binding response OmpR family regulator
VIGLVVEGGCGGVEEIVATLRLGWADIEIMSACTGGQAQECVQRSSPELMIIDTELTDTDWLRLVRDLRRLSGGVIIVLSRQFRESELMAAVEAGADDYMQVPVSSALLVARSRAALRRAFHFGNDEESMVTCGDLVADPARHEARVNGQPLRLTATEFKILHYMVKREGRVARKESLCNLVWGEDADVYSPCLRKYIQHLRRRLEEIPDCKASIVTVPKVGYRLVGDYSDTLPGSPLLN